MVDLEMLQTRADNIFRGDW